MKNKLYKTAKAVVPSLLLLLFLLPACSDESGSTPDIPETMYAKLTITLGSADNARPSYTKAETVEPSVEEDDIHERYIKHWWIVVLKDGKVDRVVSDKTGGQASTNPNPDSETNVELDLIINETYTFYAFANLDDLGTGADYISNLAEGDVLDLKKAVSLKDMSDYAIPAADASASARIPMSSYGYTYTIQDEGLNNVSIPLIRLLGKVSVEVTNATGSEATINSLVLDKFRTAGDIYLFPYDAEGSTRNLLNEDMQETYQPSFPSTTTTDYTSKNLIPEGESVTLGTGDGDNSKTYTFYANETDFSAISGLNSLQITADVKDKDNQPKPTDFSFIRRNDWLKIPLQLSNIKTTISFDMKHMPIGGLPTSITIPAGLTIPFATYWTQDHGGDIEVSYRLDEVSSLNNATIKHYISGDRWEGSTNQHPFTSAVLKEGDNASDLLINVPTNHDAAPWLTDQDAVAYTLKAGADGKSGSFTVTTQELAKSAEATIRLNLVIEGTTTDGVTKILVVPYTIVIRNKNVQTQEGGN